uniref:Ig-like domain-containing protein n=1 Tax=Paramormyrops kingsleyae TaxID=1676925 RepID=A0A3B3Q5U3_9TELE
MEKAWSNVNICLSSGDNIEQKEKELFKEEGETASLECTFSTSSTNYYIYWYRQYPGTAPEFLLFRGTYDYTAEFAKRRFSSNADKTSGRASLSILEVHLGDSAVYYCALQTTFLFPYLQMHWEHYKFYSKSKQEEKFITFVFLYRK